MGSNGNDINQKVYHRRNLFYKTDKYKFLLA